MEPRQMTVTHYEVWNFPDGPGVDKPHTLLPVDPENQESEGYYETLTQAEASQASWRLAIGGFIRVIKVTREIL